jgi:hypothetical protein
MVTPASGVAADKTYQPPVDGAQVNNGGNNGQTQGPSHGTNQSSTNYLQKIEKDLTTINQLSAGNSSNFALHVARQSLYKDLMDASNSGQIDKVLKGLTYNQIGQITSQLERGFNLQGDAAFSQDQRNSLFTAMVTGGTSGQGASGQSLAKFMSESGLSNSGDVYSLLDRSAINGPPGQINQLLSNYNSVILAAQIQNMPAAQRDQLFNDFNAKVNTANLQSLAASFTDYPTLKQFEASTGVSPSLGYMTPTGWTASSANNTDPINIVISGNSTVPLSMILRGLGNNFAEVGNDQNSGMSTEYFDPGQGPKGQDYSVRQGWLFSEAGTFGDVNHFRVWQQPGTGASFISASAEHYDANHKMPDGSVRPWHAITNYNDSRNFVINAIKQEAAQMGWKVQDNWINTGAGTGYPENKSYDGRVDVLTITDPNGLYPSPNHLAGQS